jgi:hypothetical protein
LFDHRPRLFRKIEKRLVVVSQKKYFTGETAALSQDCHATTKPRREANGRRAPSAPL